ncbi:MAG: aldehyde dehydrogenase family protein [Actinomycetota bacterium]
MTIATINPATGETLARYPAMTDAEVDARLDRAATAVRGFGRTTFADRAGVLRGVADLLEVRLDEIAALVTLEMGTTLAASRNEVEKCARTCRWYADAAPRLLADEPVDAAAVGAGRAFVTYQPLGVILAVMPWNLPIWQVIRYVAPSFMAGNVTLLKHADNVPQCAELLESLFAAAGAPDGVFQHLRVETDAVDALIRDRRVAAVMFTGSSSAGMVVAGAAGAALKKSVLELGGSDPFVVMPSADLDTAVEVGVRSRCIINGQSCIAAKRFIVHAAVYDDFRDRFVDRMGAQRLGDPNDPASDIGPLARERGRTTVEALVADAVGAGARVLCGGERPDRPGWYTPATVVEGVGSGMALHREEAFGPLAALYRADDLDRALAIANDTPYGLGAVLWSNEPEEQARAVRDIEAGSVTVNGMTISYPELPFGGVKGSGFGRELGSVGIREFCNVKSVWVGPTTG